MKKKRNPMTMERQRTERLVKKAYMSDLKCCVWLHVADGMSHEEILDELFEDFMKAYQRITFPTVEMPEITCIRSERTRRIRLEDAAIVGGELRDTIALKPSMRTDEESLIWHFAGGIWFVDHETCFCEYDANKREGGMIIFFDGENILRLLAKYPQLKRKIRFANPDQYDWMEKNW